MNTDEFAFFNQQLAGMLRTGIPLEGALRQLSQGMRGRGLRREVELLEKDLAAGVPVKEALLKGRLPGIYVQVLIAGVESQNLPGMLTLLADHYSRVSAVTARLKGLMVYPAMVLGLSLALSVFLSVLFTGIMREAEGSFFSGPVPPEMSALFWMAPVFFLSLLILFICAVSLPTARRWLRWKLPGFRDASLAQSAAAMSLMLTSGTHLDNALGLLEQIEARSPAGKDLSRWRVLLSAGAAKFQEMAVESRAFPPLFVWLVAQGGNDLADGFRRASEIYGTRARNQTDMLLYAALPLAIMFLGLLMLTQVYSLVTLVVKMLGVL